MNQKEILFFTHLVPLPPVGGGTRSYHLLRSLAKQGNVTLVLFNALTSREKELLTEVCKEIVCIDTAYPAATKSLLGKLIVTFKWMMPFLMKDAELSGRVFLLVNKQSGSRSLMQKIIFRWLFFWFSSRQVHPTEIHQVINGIDILKASINRLLEIKGKILFFDFNYFLPVVDEKHDLGGHTIIANSHNVEYLLLQQAVTFEDDLYKKLWLAAQSRFMKNAELISLARSGKVFCCSENDLEHYHSLQNDANLFVVRNGVDTDFFFPAEKNDNCRSLLFTGTMNYHPNVQGIQWFVQKVFPILLKRYPDLILTVAGREAGRLNFKSNDNIEIVNSPEDIRPWFRETCIYIVPLLQGGGTRLKIMEAAAMRRPVISTTPGAAGLDNLNGDCIVLADGELAFSSAICQLLEHRDVRDALSANIYDWVKNYSWEKIGKNMNNIVFDKN